MFIALIGQVLSLLRPEEENKLDIISKFNSKSWYLTIAHTNTLFTFSANLVLIVSDIIWLPIMTKLEFWVPVATTYFAHLVKTVNLEDKTKVGDKAAIYWLHKLFPQKAFQLLMDGCRNGDLQLLQNFINNVPDINKRNADGRNLLHETCTITPNIKIVEILILNKIDINSIDKDGNTALHLIPKHKNNNNSLVRYLIKEGIVIDAQNGVGQTALHIALIMGYQSLVQTLIDNGAKCDIEDTAGKTIFHYLVDQTRAKSEHVDSTNLQQRCASYNQKELIKFIIQRGVMHNVDAKLLNALAVFLEDKPSFSRSSSPEGILNSPRRSNQLLESHRDRGVHHIMEENGGNATTLYAQLTNLSSTESPFSTSYRNPSPRRGNIALTTSMYDDCELEKRPPLALKRTRSESGVASYYAEKHYSKWISLVVPGSRELHTEQDRMTKRQAVQRERDSQPFIEVR
jgi:ankyrin repeat protein